MGDHRKILLVEDDENDVELTLTALDRYHLANEIEVVNDGQSALDFLFREGSYADRPPGNPILVLLDLKIPRLDGLEVLRRIKSAACLRTIPVVMLTSSREEGDLLTSYNLGANAYVVKPLDFEQFMDHVGRAGLFWALINEAPPRNGHEN
ncbi:MAG: response regulator [Blastocatellia bacterium]